MNDLLNSLGLSESETVVYTVLLKNEQLTASEVAKKSGESRTNTYAILEKLCDQGIVEELSINPIKSFRVADPRTLSELLDRQKNELASTESRLETALPSLVSMYNLAQNKPGVFHYEGIDGYKKLLTDMANAKEDIWLLPSKNPPANKEVDLVLQRGLAKRRAKNIKTKALMPVEAKNWKTLDKFHKQNFEIRFIGEPVEAEIISYDNKIAFTVYEPKLITTIVTDESLAMSMQMMFCQLWGIAEK